MPLRENSDAVIRVLLVDDHPITRQGVRALIESQSDLRVCGEADTATAAAMLMAEVAPHVAIVDISLAGSDGLQLVRKLKATAPQAAVLVLSMHEESIFAERARAAGAAAYVMKQHASSVIISAIRQIVAQKGAIEPPAPSRNVKRKMDGGGIEQLSVREKEVLLSIGDGFSTREIAGKLSLSVKTIDSYREHLKLKLNVRTGEDLVRFAIQWANGEARSLRLRPPPSEACRGEKYAAPGAGVALDQPRKAERQDAARGLMKISRRARSRHTADEDAIPSSSSAEFEVGFDEE